MNLRYFTISAILKHVFVSSLLNLLIERAALHSLLLLRVLRPKNSFVVDLRDCAFDGLKSALLVLLFGLDKTAASIVGCKNMLNLILVCKIYEIAPCKVFRN